MPACALQTLLPDGNLSATFLLLAVAVALSSFTGKARADSLRCGQRIISSGDSLHTVHSSCGAPAAMQAHFETRLEPRLMSVPCGTAKTPHRRCQRLVRARTEVRIDEWTNDFGPRRFVQYLTFEGGRLVHIEVGGRGTCPPSGS